MHATMDDGTGACGGGNSDLDHIDLDYDKLEPCKKVQTSSQCIIHCTEEKGTTTSNLVSPKDLTSWKTLVRAAKIRNHTKLLEVANSTPEGEIPKISYHRNCRSIFTMKRDLDQICKLKECKRSEEN